MNRAERSRVVFWLSALGMAAFLLGLALSVLPEVGHQNLAVPLVVGGGEGYIGELLAYLRERKLAL